MSNDTNPRFDEWWMEDRGTAGPELDPDVDEVADTDIFDDPESN